MIKKLIIVTTAVLLMQASWADTGSDVNTTASRPSLALADNAAERSSGLASKLPDAVDTSANAASANAASVLNKARRG